MGRSLTCKMLRQSASRLSPVRSATRVRFAIGLVRGLAGLCTVSVLVYTYRLNIAAGYANPLDYFGYFTNQTTLVMGIVLVATGTLIIADHDPPRWLTMLRAAATAYLIVVAVIYNGLVPGTGSAPRWVSVVLHIIVPGFVVLDWLLVSDRPPLLWRRLWILLPYPIVWLVVVLARGATDGWVPYGFLLPENGPISLTLHVIGLTGAVMIAGVFVWWTSRISFIPLVPARNGAH